MIRKRPIAQFSGQPSHGTLSSLAMRGYHSNNERQCWSQFQHATFQNASSRHPSLRSHMVNPSMIHNRVQMAGSRAAPERRSRAPIDLSNTASIPGPEAPNIAYNTKDGISHLSGNCKEAGILDRLRQEHNNQSQMRHRNNIHPEMVSSSSRSNPTQMMLKNGSRASYPSFAQASCAAVRGFSNNPGARLTSLPGKRHRSMPLHPFSLGGTKVPNEQRQCTDDAQNTSANKTRLVGHPPKILYMKCDEDELNPFHCIVRKQIELFEADQEHAATNARGRNKAIVLGQVGVRCRHCKVFPPKQRGKAAIYYPAKLDRLYQACQTMAYVHLCETCEHIPNDIRKELLRLRDVKAPGRAGKKYWGDAARVKGAEETDACGLRFSSEEYP